MIPVNPMAMLLGSLLVLISLACVFALLLLAAACLIPRTRRYIGARRWRFCLLALALAAGSLPTLQLLSWQLDDWREQRALSPRLQRDEVLGDLTLPAGTQVWLERLEPLRDLSGKPLSHGLPSLQRAEFDRVPGTVLGLRVRSLELDAGRGYAALRLLEPASLDGWLCSPEEDVVFDFPFGAPFVFADWRLDSCTLAPGSEVAGVVWPDKLSVHAIEDGRWQLEPGATPVRLQGLSVRVGNLWVAGAAGELQGWQGELVEPLALGPMQYPARTRVREFRGNLLFSPLADAPARDGRHDAAVAADMSVEQNAAGQVLGVYANESVGVIDWFIMTP